MGHVLNALVADTLRRVRIDDVMAHLARITEFDRYQASFGIEHAAELIASAARAIGLADVIVDYAVADGGTPWWTFQAPRAWTPTTARLEIAGITVDHATQPFTIATYSAPTPPGGLTARVVSGDLDTLDLHGALVVIDAADFARPDLFAMLAARGAAGFVTDAPSRADLPGRIELDAQTTLFGFSITPAQRRAIDSAMLAHVRVDIDRTARMPVVTALLPGRGADEIWLTSHLCHPRPGANDNASGAAALLGVAALLVGRPLDRSIRFVWGPEFLGVASLLHERYGRLGRDGRPVAVINLDMVGEDPVQCGVPLVVERTPDWCASVITPVAEYVVEQVFAQTSTHAGTWRPGPFFGFSDHALFANFADPSWRSAAVQLWHPSDPFNHSAADTLDKVSPIELARATVAGAVIAEVLANGTDSLPACIDRWCERETRAMAGVIEQHRDVEAGAWSRRFEAHVRDQCELMRALAWGGPITMRAPSPRKHAFTARWPGPFNYRGLLAALSASRRAEMMALFIADKRNYAVLTHLAMRAETSSHRDEAIDATSIALRAPVDKAAAEQLWSALLEAGWIEEARHG
jgi:Peptidase family M28